MPPILFAIYFWTTIKRLYDAIKLEEKRKRSQYTLGFGIYTLGRTLETKLELKELI